LNLGKIKNLIRESLIATHPLPNKVIFFTPLLPMNELGFLSFEILVDFVLSQKNFCEMSSVMAFKKFHPPSIYE
jgi:hypothetical protein